MPAVVRRSCLVAAPPARVWARVTTPQGINHELMPVMRMVVPRSFAGRTIADVVPDERIGRAWILYLGFLPLDYDDLTITEVSQLHFQERSTMASMRRWSHRRTLEPRGSGTVVTDQLEFEARIAALTPLLRPVVAALFAHRQRRLVRWFAH